jgi:cytochrome c-type biogenesis protein CcmH/NrfG
LTLEAGGTVTPAAHAEFIRAPDDPRSIFYLAVEIAQHGDTHGAIARLQALALEAPKEASWRGIVLDELHALGSGPQAEAVPPRSAINDVEDELSRLGPPDARSQLAAPGAR